MPTVNAGKHGLGDSGARVALRCVEESSLRAFEHARIDYLPGA